MNWMGDFFDGQEDGNISDNWELEKVRERKQERPQGLEKGKRRLGI